MCHADVVAAYSCTVIYVEEKIEYLLLLQSPNTKTFAASSRLNLVYPQSALLTRVYLCRNTRPRGLTRRPISPLAAGPGRDRPRAVPKKHPKKAVPLDPFLLPLLSARPAGLRKEGFHHVSQRIRSRYTRSSNTRNERARADHFIASSLTLTSDATTTKAKTGLFR